MPSKPIDLPAEVTKAFIADMRAFFTEKGAIKRDEMRSQSIGSSHLNEYLGKRQWPLRVTDVKEMFVKIRDQT